MHSPGIASVHMLRNVEYSILLVMSELSTVRCDRALGLWIAGTRSHPTAEVLSSKRSLLRDAAVLMKIQSAVLEGPRNPGRWPVLRKQPKLHAREDSRLHAVALDAVPALAF